MVSKKPEMSLPISALFPDCNWAACIQIQQPPSDDHDLISSVSKALTQGISGADLTDIPLERLEENLNVMQAAIIARKANTPRSSQASTLPSLLQQPDLQQKYDLRTLQQPAFWPMQKPTVFHQMSRRRSNLRLPMMTPIGRRQVKPRAGGV